MFDFCVRAQRASRARPASSSCRAMAARDGKRCTVLMSLAFFSMPALAAGQDAPLSVAQTPRLNDTGQVNCYDATTRTQLGTVSSGTPQGTITNDALLRQDCTRGASAADAMGLMAKHGASATKGRDYTKIGNDGSELASNATLGTGPTDWACTQDNLTGLIWEIKTATAGDLRFYASSYTWYETDAAVNGGNAGDPGFNSCGSTLPLNKCNTTAFREAVNAAGLCGHNDWRLPTQKELQTLVDYNKGTAPTIDTVWFPNTPSASYAVVAWSGVTYAPDASAAWSVDFTDGFVDRKPKTAGSYNHGIRLVRGGP